MPEIKPDSVETEYKVVRLPKPLWERLKKEMRPYETYAAVIDRLLNEAQR